MFYLTACKKCTLNNNHLQPALMAAVKMKHKSEYKCTSGHLQGSELEHRDVCKLLYGLQTAFIDFGMCYNSDVNMKAIHVL